MIVYFAVGVYPLKFFNPPPQVSSGYLGMNFDFNCSTDDANATVKLFFAADFVNYNERTLSPEKLHLNKQVFTLLNLGGKMVDNIGVKQQMEKKPLNGQALMVYSFFLKVGGTQALIMYSVA